jgi:A/G-specific adenine glycosylase
MLEQIRATRSFREVREMNGAPRMALDSSEHPVVSGILVTSSLSLSRPSARREFRSRLLAWFDAHARDLPWRRTRDPYAIWVSEIMLQQTRVAAVIERYTVFVDRLPTVAALAAAQEADVLALWSGLGYYRRARMMHRAARIVADDLHDKLPSTAEELRKLPGIGSYTSAAIASIAFGEAVAVVDGNVERVVMRLMGWDETPLPGPLNGQTQPRVTSRVLPESAQPPLAGRIQQQASRLLDPNRPGDFNQAMMELGATICQSRRPLCLQCPVYDYCRTRGEHVTTPSPAMSGEHVACALVRRDGHDNQAGSEVLLEQRPQTATVMASMWELPALEAPLPPNQTILTVKHAIMRVNYTVAVVTIPQSELPRTTATRQWFSLNQLPTLPLTGLARKVFIALDLFPQKKQPTARQ